MLIGPPSVTVKVQRREGRRLSELKDLLSSHFLFFSAEVLEKFEKKNKKTDVFGLVFINQGTKDERLSKTKRRWQTSNFSVHTIRKLSSVLLSDEASHPQVLRVIC